ncbi:benzoate/H(+) symporter BenE family transporter [Pelagibius sp. CAU 1746]|uniref:benzoate/H(+) symporter BenE family transporter n=1 Tax=Pelagibius sp. CAU 1746 TaxID=3140370 RepID=UPI00325C09B4
MTEISIRAGGGFSLQAASAGLLAAFVGFASSFAVVIQGLLAIGASQGEAASGLMALAIAMGLCGVWLSLKTRLPVSIAWSTPGAALLATTGAVEGGFAAAVGAFLMSGVLIVAAGLWRPLGRWVAAIPPALANAMLAGVLFTFCLAPVRAVAEGPELTLPVILAWALAWRFKRLYAIPAALLAALAMIFATTEVPSLDAAALWPQPLPIMPQFTLSALVGIALPLFIVTMASQNIPGMAVLNANGYRPAPGPLFATSGVFTLLAAPFGGHAVNLAAITAALCAGEDAHPDPARRYWAAVVSGAFYVVFGLLAGLITAFVAAVPAYLILTVAGLALLGAFGSALTEALAAAEDRLAAIVTFLATASGLSFFGIGSAFWGLLAGLALYALTRWRPGRRR